MSGTIEGGRKAAETNKKRYGEAFYSNVGRKGGVTSHLINPITGKAIKGFAISGKAASAGALGGSRSRRGKAKKVQ